MRWILDKIVIVATVWCVAFLPSCGSSDKSDNNADADRLFSETCRLTKLYTDSMKNAPDSAILNSLMERFDARLTDINFSVKAETDYNLTEGRNDTIASLIDSLRHAYDSRLYRLAHPINEPADSAAIPSSRNSGNQTPD